MSSKYSIFITVLLVVVIVSFASSAENQEDARKFEVLGVEALLDAIDVPDPFSEDDARSICVRFGRGKDQVANMKSVLEDSRESVSFRNHVAIVLGIHGGAEARDALIRFIDSPLPPELTSDSLELLRWAIKSLGWIGDELAIKKLKSLASKKYWDEREAHPITIPSKYYVGADVESTQRLLREAARVGVLIEGRADSVQIAEDLISRGYLADLGIERKEQFLEEAKRAEEGFLNSENQN